MMLYADYGTGHTYVIVHTGGGRATGDPETDFGVVFSSDDREEAKQEATRLYFQYNTPEAIKSTWEYHHFSVNIDTSSPKGEEMRQKFSYQFDEMFERKMDEGTHELISLGDTQCLVPKDDLFKKEEADPAKWGSRLICIDLGKNKET